MNLTLKHLAAGAVWLLAATPAALMHGQVKSLPLTSASGLELVNLDARAVEHRGAKGLELTASEESLKKREAALAEARRKAGASGDMREAGRIDHLALVEGLDFTNGTIEVSIAGAPAPGSGAGGARGFVGVAFRVQPDNRTYDAFYLRPTNGRADDQERRNHSAQYISHPEWTWFLLREKFPSKYESYVDLQPGEWIKVRITVEGEKARLYVHGNEQPTLIVNDMKSGPNGKGRVALWIEGSTVAHFRDLRITPK